MEISSSFKLQKTLRESAKQIEGICFLNREGLFITYDEVATRLWSLSKQIKARHERSSDLNKFKLLTMNPLDSIDAVIMLFTSKINNSSGEGLVRLISSSLEILQEINLKLPKIEKFSFSPNQTELLLLDKAKSGHVLHIDVQKNESVTSQKSVQDVLDKLTINESAKSAKYDYNPRKKHIEYIKVMKVQVIDCEQVAVVDFIMNNDNTILVLTNTDIMVLSRPGLKAEPASPTRSSFKFKSRKSSGSVTSTDDSSAQTTKSEPIDYAQFIHTASLMLKYNSGKRKPMIIKEFRQRFLIIGYTDGWIQIINYSQKFISNKPLDNDGLSASFMLCEFLAVQPILKDQPSQLISIFDGMSVNSYGNKCFLLEFFTLGNDLRIIHWGARVISPDKQGMFSLEFDLEELKPKIERIVENPEKPKFYTEKLLIVGKFDIPITMEYIGHYQFQESPPSEVKHLIQADKLIYKTQLIASQLTNNSTEPVSHILLGTFGGMILMWDLIHPHRKIITWFSNVVLAKNKALSINDATTYDLKQIIYTAIRGPDLLEKINLRMDIDPWKNETLVKDKVVIPTALIMKEDTIELIIANTGECVQTLSLNYIQEQLAQYQTVNVNLLNPPQKRIETGDKFEGKATIIHWCPYSQFILIGYNSGGVGLLTFNYPIETKNNADFAYLRSTKVHSSAITMIKTFKYTMLKQVSLDPLIPIQEETVVVAILGDASGIISLWQISPMRKSGSPLLFQSKQHLGQVKYCSVNMIPQGTVTDLDQLDRAAEKMKQLNSNHNILVTGCDRGIIQAWRIQNNLSLQIVAYMNASRISHQTIKLESLLTIPKMIYRSLEIKKPDVELPFSNFRKTKKDFSDEFNESGEIKPPDETIEVASLFYEIYCILGFSDGTVQVWNFSSDPSNSISQSICSRLDLNFPLVSLLGFTSHLMHQDEPLTTENKNNSFGFIQTIPNTIQQEFSLVNSCDKIGENSYEFNPVLNKHLVIAGHDNGTIVIYQLEINPQQIVGKEETSTKVSLLFTKLSYLNIPYPLHSLLSLQSSFSPSMRNIKHRWELLFISEFDIVRFYPFAVPGETIPETWQIGSNLDNLLNTKEEKQPTFQRLAEPKKAPSRPHTQSLANLLATNELKHTKDNINEIFPSLIPQSAPPPNNEEIYSISNINPFDLKINTKNENEIDDVQSTGEAEELKSMTDSIQDSKPYLKRNDTNSSFPSNGSSPTNKLDKRQYIGPMETMQRIMSSDLHIAKKDKKLLEIFTHHGPDIEGTIQADSAINVVWDWLMSEDVLVNKFKIKQQSRSDKQPSLILSKSLNMGAKDDDASEKSNFPLDIKKENLWELFKLLEINTDDKLKFIEVAKVAAITFSALQRTLTMQKSSQSSQFRKNKPYNQLKSQTVRVTYNSMGEKVMEKITIPNETLGKPLGSTADFRKILYSTVKQLRSPIKSRPKIYKADRKLENIPKEIASLIKPQLFPVETNEWSTLNLHYFDYLRTIRIARNLLDVRNIQQNEAAQKYNSFETIPSIDSMAKTLLKYFERQYGECSRSMNVATYKVSNYLEAILQYEEFPILRIMKFLLSLAQISSSTNDGKELALWLIVEARNWLFSNGYVFAGREIKSTEDLIQEEIRKNETGVNKAEIDAMSSELKYLYVSKANALFCCDELLRKRCQLGPRVYMTILESINNLPGKSNVLNDDIDEEEDNEDLYPTWFKSENESKSNNQDKYIDLEWFLEVLYTEFISFDHSNHFLYTSLYQGEYFSHDNQVHTLTAVSRDITRPNSMSKSHPSREFDKSLIIDDQDQQIYGPFHFQNLSLIYELFFQCIRQDPMRTGEIFSQNVKPIMLEVFINRFPEEEKSNVFVVIEELEKKVNLKGIEEKVSYLDMIAILFAWEEQNLGYLHMDITELERSLPKLIRSIESDLARDLVKFMTGISALPYYRNPLWVMGKSLLKSPDNPKESIMIHSHSTSALPNQTIQSNKPLSIPTEGVWRPISTIPSDLPGMLHSQSLPVLERNILKDLPISKKEEHKREIGELVAPSTMQSDRIRQTLYGETVKSFQGLKQAPIVIKDLSADFNNENIGRMLNSHNRDDDIMIQREALKSSYSRALETVPLSGLEDAPNEDGENFQLSKDALDYVSPSKSFSWNGLFHSDNQRESDTGIRTGRDHTTINPPKIYGLIRSDSLNSVDSNYQHYELELNDNENTYTISAAESTIVDSKLHPEKPYDNLVFTPFLKFRDEELFNQSQSRLGTAGSMFSGGSPRQQGSTFSASKINIGSPSETSLIDKSSSIGTLHQSLASLEIQRRIHTLQKVEEEFQQMYEQEMLEFQERRMEKLRLRDMINREMTSKERESMKFLRDQLDKRSEQLQKGRAQLALMELQEKQDREKDDLAKQALLEANRQKLLSRQQDKLTAQDKERETKRIEKENKLMKKEDELSQQVKDMYILQLKKEEEERKKREQEEIAKMLEALTVKETPPPIELAPSLDEEEIEEPGEEPEADDDQELEEEEPDEVPEPEEDVEVEEEEGDLEPEIELEELLAPEPPQTTSVEEYIEEYDESTLTEVERYIQSVLRGLKTALREHPRHPRKLFGKFFIPMNFANDITFDPFNSTILASEIVAFEKSENGSPITPPQVTDIEEEDEESTPISPFADIEQAVKKLRKINERNRKLLFKTEAPNVPANQWTPIFRTSTVDWKGYFRKEKHKFQLIKQMQLMEDEDRETEDYEDFDSSSRPTTQRTPKSTARSNKNTPYTSFSFPILDDSQLQAIPEDLPQSPIPASILQSIPVDPSMDIVPLPFGKVLKNEMVFGASLKFYQMEITNIHTILTVEINCLKGIADLYIHYNKLPTTVKYLEKVSCKKDKGERKKRMTFIPEFSGTYFLGVHSTGTGAEFNIWAYSSFAPEDPESSLLQHGEAARLLNKNDDEDELLQQNPSLAKVDHIITKWKLMLNPSVMPKNTDQSSTNPVNSIPSFPPLTSSTETPSQEEKTAEEKILQDLLIHFPRLEQEAEAKNLILDQQRALRREGKKLLIEEMKQKAQEYELRQLAIEQMEYPDEKLEEELEAEIEAEDIDSFIVKVGRFVIRKERDQIEYQKERKKMIAEGLEAPSDKRMVTPESVVSDSIDLKHQDLFTSPQVNRIKSMAILTPVNLDIDYDTELSNVRKEQEERKKELMKLRGSPSSNALSFLPGLRHSREGTPDRTSPTKRKNKFNRGNSRGILLHQDSSRSNISLNSNSNSNAVTPSASRQASFRANIEDDDDEENEKKIQEPTSRPSSRMIKFQDEELLNTSTKTSAQPSESPSREQSRQEERASSKDSLSILVDEPNDQKPSGNQLPRVQECASTDELVVISQGSEFLPRSALAFKRDQLRNQLIQQQTDSWSVLSPLSSSMQANRSLNSESTFLAKLPHLPPGLSNEQAYNQHRNKRSKVHGVKTALEVFAAMNPKPISYKLEKIDLAKTKK